MASGVLVIAEIAHGAISPHTREVLTAGRGLADALSQDLGLLVWSDTAGAHAEDGVGYGADVVYSASDPQFGLYHAEMVLDFIVGAVRALEPRAVLLPHSPLGSDIAPRLAYRLETTWGAGCVAVGLQAETGLISQTRLIWGGKVLVDEVFQRTPAVISLRAKSYDPAERDETRAGRQEPVALAPVEATGVRNLQRLQQAQGIADELREAEVVVSGGRGMGSAEAFDLLTEVASALGGTVGASKAVIDAGWMPAERQVGLSGVTVAPRLYLAVAISGASQHIAGCSKSELLVAINKDPDAPIFRYAKYGIVGEWQKVLPPMLAGLKTAAAVGATD